MNEIKQITIFIILILILCSFVYSESLGTFKQGSCITLIENCDNCTYVNISSVTYPNSSTAEENLNMTKIGTEYRRQFCNTSAIGVYQVFAYGDANGVGSTITDGYDFKITQFGVDKEDTNSGLPLILFMLFMIIGLFALGFLGKFNKYEIVNLCLKRGCFVIAIMISMYTATLLLNLFAYSNMDIIGNEMSFIINWVGYAGYIATVYLFIQTLFDIFRLKKERRDKRMFEVE